MNSRSPRQTSRWSSRNSVILLDFSVMLSTLETENIMKPKFRRMMRDTTSYLESRHNFTWGLWSNCTEAPHQWSPRLTCWPSSRPWRILSTPEDKRRHDPIYAYIQVHSRWRHYFQTVIMNDSVDSSSTIDDPSCFCCWAAKKCDFWKHICLLLAEILADQIFHKWKKMIFSEISVSTDIFLIKSKDWEDIRIV